MKNSIQFVLGALLVVLLYSCSTNTDNKANQSFYSFDAENSNNDYFDNSQINELPLNEIYVGGEVLTEGVVDFSTLPLCSVLVKETELINMDTTFVGAYKYIGYSLHDILKPYTLNKKNADHFKPNIDAYIEIENADGQCTYFSWGEVFFPNNRNHIIIAKAVMRIVPEKSKDQWPLPKTSKVVVVSDLITGRNISNPVKITVKSYPKLLDVKKGLKPLYSDNIKLYNENKLIETFIAIGAEKQQEAIHTIFYGKGRGIHSVHAHSGLYLKDLLATHFSSSQKSIQKGLFVIAAKDGYRGVFSYSEIMNRNDQAEVLFMCDAELKDKGIFRIIPSADFFSDRAIKGISEIWYSENEQ
ncbi:MAG: hypothetical protein JEZ09_10915 [Salinivirgaceae bacterium]|nr:hypothetical protein [Salinivirgaceae bacterium]